MGGIWGIYKPEPTHVEGVKIVACRGSVIQGSEGRKKKRPKRKKKAVWEKKHSNAETPWKKRYCVQGVLSELGLA